MSHRTPTPAGLSPSSLRRATIEHAVARVPQKTKIFSSAACSVGPRAPISSAARERLVDGPEREEEMAILIGDTAPDFEAETTEGHIHFYDYIEGKWAVLFSHPKNFTPVCTTELGYTAKLKPEFDKRGVVVLGLSVDELKNHAGWSKDIEETQGQNLNFPLIADTNRASRDQIRDDPSQRRQLG